MQLNLESLAETKQQLLILTAALILFIFAIVSGIITGRSAAKAEADYSNVLALQSALKYYFSDQDRFPSADQFYNQKILVPAYLSALPNALGKSGVCKNYGKYVYSQDSIKDFSLIFCLVKATNGLSAGPHQLTSKGVK